MLLELREAATLPKRVLELAIVTVSKLNECDYCVAHHTPFLVVAVIQNVLDTSSRDAFNYEERGVVRHAIITLVEFGDRDDCKLEDAFR